MKLLSRPATDWRYRAYFVLMDASAVALVIGSADFLGGRLLGTGFEDLVPHPWILVIGLPVLFLNVIVATFPVVARLMREDYLLAFGLCTVFYAGYIFQWSRDHFGAS